VDLRNLKRHLQNGVHPRFRVVSGVRGAADGLENENTRPLAARLERSMGQGRFEAQNPSMEASLFFQELPRCPAAGLLVGRQQARDGRRRRDAGRLQGPHGAKRHGDAALHVEDARTEGPAVLNPPWRLPDRADGVYRVDVVQEQRAPVPFPPADEPMIAGGGLREALRLPATALECLRQPGTQPVDRLLIRRRRLHFDHAAQGLQHLILPGTEVGEREGRH